MQKISIAKADVDMLQPGVKVTLTSGQKGKIIWTTEYRIDADVAVKWDNGSSCIFAKSICAGVFIRPNQ